MTTVDTVTSERRLRPRVAAAAAVGGLLLFGSMILQTTGPQAKVSELTVQLLVTERRAGLEVITSIVSALGLIGLGATLAFLFTAVKARRPGMSRAAWFILLAGIVLAVAGGIGYGIVIVSKAHQFTTSGLQTYPEANRLLAHGPVAVLQYMGLVGALLVAVAFVLVVLNAMRVGLLTKFGGYLGMGAAAASLLLIGSAPALLIEVFWLLSTAFLLAGRWPNGDPPAWTTGEAVPWPSSAELREQRMAARGQGRDPRQGARRAPKRERGAPATVTTTVTAPRSTGAKRKRKRRK